jgi:putative DNA primase/helicase
MVRRTLICRLDPNMERPETRQFKRNPFKDVLADRGKYIGAAMTIARAYLAAGEPGVDAATLASFENWSRFVQRPLIWLGRADPAKSIENISGDDPEQNTLRMVLIAWHAAVAIQPSQSRNCGQHKATTCEKPCATQHREKMAR